MFWALGARPHCPSTLPLFPGKGLQRRVWLDHSVPSKSRDQVIDPQRKHAEVVSLGTRHDKGSTGSCSRSIEADGFPEMAPILKEPPRAALCPGT